MRRRGLIKHWKEHRACLHGTENRCANGGCDMSTQVFEVAEVAEVAERSPFSQHGVGSV